MSPRVLLVSRALTPPWDEASKNFARELATASASDMSVLVAEPTDELPSRVRQIPLYTRTGLSWGQRARLLRLRRMQRSVDVVHLLFTPTLLNAVLFRTILGRRRPATVQTVASLNGRDYTAREARRIFFADALVTYSEFSRSRLEALGFPRVTAIQPGIDLARFSPAPRNAALAASLGIAADDLVVMYPGEYTRLGATDALVEALPRLLALSSKLRFVFGCRVKNAADAEKKQAVMRRVAEFGLTDRVSYTDTLRDMPGLYNLSDVVVFPVLDMVGKFDVPLAVVEAMACARPVVVSDLEVLAEFTSGGTTVQIPTGDLETLIAVVGDLLADPARGAELGDAARSFVVSRFDIIEIARRYDAVYAGLAKTEAAR